jgi:hypothetical protein
MTDTIPALPRADRPQYFAGQTLTADDLTAAQDVDTGLRRLHHRMLHGWGIASGLTVTGSRGGATVSIGAGYALDSTGRELVLVEPAGLKVPAVAGDPQGRPEAYTLVLRWTEDHDAVVLTRSGACGTEGAVRRSDAPTIEWVKGGAVRVGHELVLADVLVQNCRLTAPPDDSGRRQLNPPPTPYAASGATTPGETIWTMRSAAGLAPWGVETLVDTSEAGFGDAPAYLARLVGTRFVSAASTTHGAPFLLDGTPSIEDAEPGRFRLVVPLLHAMLTHPTNLTVIELNPPAVVGSPELETLASHTLAWSVEWIGVQS